MRFEAFGNVYPKKLKNNFGFSKVRLTPQRWENKLPKNINIQAQINHFYNNFFVKNLNFKIKKIKCRSYMIISKQYIKEKLYSGVAYFLSYFILSIDYKYFKKIN